MTELFEIIVWVEGRSSGDRFLNQTEDIITSVNQALRCGLAFALIQNKKSMMTYAPGKVTHIQVSSYYGEKSDVTND